MQLMVKERTSARGRMMEEMRAIYEEVRARVCETGSSVRGVCASKDHEQLLWVLEAKSPDGIQHMKRGQGETREILR